MTMKNIRRGLGALISSVLMSFLVAAFVFAPLHASAVVGAASASAASVVWLLLWWRLPLRLPARLLPRTALFVIPVILLVVCVGITVAQVYAVGAFPPLGGDRVESFDRLWRAIRDTYPYFDLKGVDWEEVYSRYHPQIVAAVGDTTAADDATYFHLIADMLSELNDGHTGLSDPAPSFAAWFGRLEDVEGQVLLMGVTDQAAAAGLSRGDVITALDDRSVDDAIAALPPALRDGSTSWGRRDAALSNVFAIFDDDADLNVTFTDADGESHTVTLTPTPIDTTSSAGQSAPVVSGKRLDSGVGYLRIPRFWERGSEDLIAQFDSALESLMDAPGLIIDLRDNGGGSSLLADAMAGRLIDQPFVYGRDLWRVRLPQRLWWDYSEYHIDPRGTPYRGEIALLTDATCASSAEWFIVSLVDSGRARTVGRTTTGATGNPLTFQLPEGGAARFSTGDFRRVDGSRVEGVGIAPDVPVTWTIDDVRTGRDPDIAAAERLLGAAVE